MVKIEASKELAEKAHEAIEIAKIYSTSDSGKFVNGILDKVVKREKQRKQKRTMDL